ncbi:MAG: thiamine pyrophosphate-dependent enzyme [Rectinemataceae bacterium]|jgi:3D-(3,5/4)-trihydroxycyclohexane-1,2-dione acylhydrolase (decyclizing)
MMGGAEYGARLARAQAIQGSGGVDAALASGALARKLDVTPSEALVIGLLRQGVRKYIGVFGHGTTELGESLRAYAEAGAVEVFNVRSEIEASHAATALKWQYGETAAVFTSIGPGALQALGASLVPASNSMGLYYLLGDETTHDEGYNMQQIPRPEQASFLRLAQAMGSAYTLHTGWALPAALKRGIEAAFGPVRPRPFYLLLPMNIQGKVMRNFNLAELPRVPSYSAAAPAGDGPYLEAARLIVKAERIVVKTGNGARGLDPVLLDEFLRRSDAAYVHGPSAVGILPGSHQRNMTVGGSKGSISGNAAMAAADLVVTIGARAVCQWDSSGTAWKSAKSVIAINTDYQDASHYNGSLPLVGDACVVVKRLVATLRMEGVDKGGTPTQWFEKCRSKRREWDAFLTERLSAPPILDQKFGRPLLTQPVAIAVVADFARKRGAVKYFDAGDVQANGFQIIEDEKVGDTYTDTGASYMGFAVSAILAAAVAEAPRYPIAFTGDGSFMMCPQILLDAAVYGLRGMIVLFDNRRMAAISSLQHAQYGAEFRTDDRVEVDYPSMARSFAGVRGFEGGLSRSELEAALEEAYAHEGLSLVHVRVYSGPDERGGLGAYGDWNVGAWCERVQREKHEIGM